MGIEVNHAPMGKQINNAIINEAKWTIYQREVANFIAALRAN